MYSTSHAVLSSSPLDVPFPSSDLAMKSPETVPASLGIIAEIASPSDGTLSDADASKARSLRVLSRFALQAQAREILPAGRIASCLRSIIPGQSTVDVLHLPEARSAAFRSLQVCASIICPVCGPKLSERRKAELDKAVSRWIDAGGHVVMVTFTVAHSKLDGLDELLTGLQSAYRLFTAGRWYKNFKSRFAVVGTVKALEVTYSRFNGFHPHLHCLMFLEKPLSPKAFLLFRKMIKQCWLARLETFNRSASWEYGVDVANSNKKISDYVAKFGKEPKWTIGSEMTKSYVKTSKSAEHYTPMELLVNAYNGDDEAAKVWWYYAISMKGYHTLQWSRGLRALVLPDDAEKTDEEVVNEHSQDAYLLGSLTRSQWQVVIANDARAELLNVAATGDVDMFLSFLRSIGVRLGDFNALNDYPEHYTSGFSPDAVFDFESDAKSPEYADYWNSRL